MAKKPGPKSKLTPERMKKIREAMLGEDAVSFYVSCARAGVSEDTARRWRRQGERDRAADRRTEFAKLSEAADLRRAERVAAGEATLDELSSKAEDRVRFNVAAFTLRSLRREEYGDQLEIRVRGELERIMEAVRPLMPRQSFLDFLRAVAQVEGVVLDADAESELDSPAASGSDEDGAADPGDMH